MNAYATHDAYTQASTKERVKLEALYKLVGITRYKFTPVSGYDRVEGLFISPNGNKYVVEAKVRTGNMDFYKDHMIEKKKYDVLEGYFHKDIRPLYINFFDDGVIVYNLTNRMENQSIEWKTQKCRGTTAVLSGYVDKLVGFLAVGEGDNKIKTKL